MNTKDKTTSSSKPTEDFKGLIKIWQEGQIKPLQARIYNEHLGLEHTELDKHSQQALERISPSGVMEQTTSQSNYLDPSSNTLGTSFAISKPQR